MSLFRNLIICAAVIGWCAPAPAQQPASPRDHCREFASDAQRATAREMISRAGYDCRSVTAMCPYMLSEGFHVFCNDYRYEFAIENHGGKVSVIAK